MYDIIMKAIFIDEVNSLAKMISDITGIDYNLLEDNMILEINELPINVKDEKAKRCDFILKIDKDNILNLELNTSYYPGLIIKNLSYLFGIYSSTTKKGDSYNENIIIRQINLNCYNDSSLKSLSKYTLREEETNQIYSKSIVIYDLNVVNCNDVYYNQCNNEEIPNYVRWGTLLYNKDFDKIPEIAEGIMTKEEVGRIMDKVDKLTSDSLFMSELEYLKMYEKEEKAKMEYACSLASERGYATGHEKGLVDGFDQGRAEGRVEGHAEGRAEGHAVGHAEGCEETIISTVKKLVDKNIDINDISDITGKSIDEIKKIIED